jgi:retron-type reverse transcriptase
VPRGSKEDTWSKNRQAGVPQGSVLSPTLYSIHVYINDTPRTPDVYLGLFADDTCIYATDRKEGYVLRKLQRGLSAIETWCERWNIKINEDKTQAIYNWVDHGWMVVVL